MSRSVKAFRKSAVLPVAKFAAQDTGRPVLACVSVRNGEVAASDGFTLARADMVDREIDRDGPVENPETLMLAKDVVSVFPGNDPGGSYGIDDYVADPKTGDRVRLLTLGANDAVTAREVGTINGTFPDLNQIFPTEEPTAVVVIDAFFLKRIAEAAIQAAKLEGEGKRERGIQNPVPVMVSVRKPVQPVEFTARCGDQGYLDMLVMPMVVQEGARETVNRPMKRYRERQAVEPAPVAQAAD